MKFWVLRRSAPGDHATLLDLWVEAWTSAMPGIDFEARRSWFATHMEHLEATGAVTILATGSESPDRTEVGPAIQGFVTLNPVTHYLDQLAVRPQQRGTGLGARLITEARRLSPSRLELHVNQDNGRAVSFYRREGFAIIGEGHNPQSKLAIWHMAWTRL